MAMLELAVMAFVLLMGVLLLKRAILTTPSVNDPEQKEQKSVDISASNTLVVLDGANLAFAYGAALRSHLGLERGRAYPCSAGILAGLRYFENRGINAIAVLPRALLEGRKTYHLCDGTKGQQTRHARSLPGSRFSQVKSKDGLLWRHSNLWKEHLRGRLVLVGRRERCLDDLKAIELVRDAQEGGWLCSNDRFKDHWKKTLRGFQLGELKTWLRRKQFGYYFRVDSVQLDQISVAKMQDRIVNLLPQGQATQLPVEKHGWRALSPDLGFWIGLPEDLLSMHFVPRLSPVQREAILSDNLVKR